MYGAVASVELGTYDDLWRPGRYRVELKAGLPVSLHAVEADLEQLGYEPIDADQWGSSYRYVTDASRTAELDELDGPSPAVRLILRQSDLDEAGLSHAEGELDLEYSGIRSLCPSQSEEAAYAAWLATTGKWTHGTTSAPPGGA